MNVWEETWRVELDSSRTHQNLVVDQDGIGVIVAQGCGGSDEDDARAALASAAPEMARLLLELLGSGSLNGERRTSVEAVLRKAGTTPIGSQRGTMSKCVHGTEYCIADHEAETCYSSPPKASRLEALEAGIERLIADYDMLLETRHIAKDLRELLSATERHGEEP